MLDLNLNISQQKSNSTDPTETTLAHAVSSSHLAPTIRILWAALAALILLGFFGHLAFGFETDELTHLHQAWNIGQGLMPYKDFYIVHLPLFHYLLAPFVGHFTGSAYASLLPLRIGALLIAMAGTAILYRLLKREVGLELAVWGVGIWILTAPFDTVGLEIRPDMPALACLLAAVVFLSRALTRSGRGVTGLCFGAGLLSATASCLTQKAVILAAGILLWMFCACLLSPQQLRVKRALSIAAFLSGLAIPVAVLLHFLSSHEALRSMVQFTILYPFQIKHVPPWRHTIQESLIAGFPFYVLACSEAASIFSNAKRHFAEASTASLVAVILMIGTLAQVKTTAPTRQWMLISITPWMAFLAIRAASRYLRSPQEIVIDRNRLLASIFVCALGLFWHNSPPTVGVWALIAWFCYRAMLRKGPQNRELNIVLPALLSVNLIMLVAHGTNCFKLQEGGEQRKLMEFVASKSKPNERVVQVWPTIAPYNPDAAFYWYAYDDTVHDMPKDEIQDGLIGALVNGRAHLAAVSPITLRVALPRLSAYLENNCTPVAATPSTRHRIQLFECRH